MINKILAASMSYLLLTSAAWSIDISPYQPGQKLTQAQAKELKKRYSDREVQPWVAAPVVASIKSHQDAELINYGIQLLDKTATTMGPKVADKKLRYSGNGLNCSSCHIKGTDGLPGTKPFGIPFNNVVNDYPNFRSRSMSIGTAADRVNGCMTRSMGSNGKPLPEDSREMQGILAYFSWLATNTDKNKAMLGTGLPKLALPTRAASIESGAQVFKTKCLSCHGEGALGMPAPDYAQTHAYIFPPLAGPDSFNNGAGMSRIIKASRFIHANMPMGVNYEKPALSAEQAFDVAGYLQSLQRDDRPNRDQDFPDPAFRPADYPVPAYFGGDGDALERAKYGPFGE